MVVGEAKLLVELLSHLTTLPVCPDKVKVPELLPGHTVAVPLTEPPTETGETVIVPVAFTVPQPPVNGML
jgi:hypothetical protein